MWLRHCHVSRLTGQQPPNIIFRTLRAHLSLSTAMLDFTSALYLGFRHPNRSLRPWSQFTTGVPPIGPGRYQRYK
jgi:hypothetical protein